MGNRSFILSNQVRWEHHDRMVMSFAGKDKSNREISFITQHFLRAFDLHADPAHTHLLRRDAKEFTVDLQATHAARQAWNEVARRFGEIDFW